MVSKDLDLAAVIGFKGKFVTEVVWLSHFKYILLKQLGFLV